MAHCLEPERPAALVAYLASPACTVTGEIFSQVGPRYSRVCFAVTGGWLSPAEKPPTAEEVAQHFDEIRVIENLSFPTSMPDDFEAAVRAMQTSG